MKLTEAPRRVQLSRRKGWRMPPNTVKVDRATKWGNPWRVEQHQSGRWFVAGPSISRRYCGNKEGAQLVAVGFLRKAIDQRLFHHLDFGPDEVAQLRGKNLACWRRLDQPCHADVLLELANAPAAALLRGGKTE